MGENCQKPVRRVTKTGNSSTPKTRVKPWNGWGVGVFQGRLKKIDEIARCTSLEVLQFVACRLAGDVSSLSRLAQLRALRFEGKNKLQGWESLHSETLRNFWATDLPCRFRPEQFPHIENYVINTYRNKDPFRMVVGDPDEIEEAFASIFTE